MSQGEGTRGRGLCVKAAAEGDSVGPTGPGGLPSRCGQGLVEVLEDVVDVLDADAKPDDVRRDAGGLLLVLGHLPVRRRGRMRRQRAHVADVDEALEDLERVVELDAGLVAALDAEAQQA